MPASPAMQQNVRFTWDDYRAWSDDERWELIDGVAHAMSPAPTIRHQDAVGSLFSLIRSQLRGAPCRPFVAPVDVKLSDADVVQPDVLVVCDPSRITETHIEGAPDLIVEVVDPTTAARDLREKRDLYERSGVREYLVIHPLSHYATRFELTTDGFDKGSVIAADEVITFATLPDVEVPLWEVLGLPGPAAADDVDSGAAGASESAEADGVG